MIQTIPQSAIPILPKGLSGALEPTDIPPNIIPSEATAMLNQLIHPRKGKSAKIMTIKDIIPIIKLIRPMFFNSFFK
ncbi:hypothetical protein M1N11_01815 [Peptococcaceae bacterium]|nr:hypothetical protein [Peptococcaceae bacterium]